MAKQRPPIPAEVQREVRRRCGFGCVLCGLPIYQIHHIEGDPTIHNPKDMALLCPNHHEMEKKGLIPKEQVRAANADPVNHRRNVSRAQKLDGFTDSSCSFIVGDCKFQNVGPNAGFAPIMIDGLPILAFHFEDGHALLHLHLFNEYNEPVLFVEDGWLVIWTMPWDITFEGRVLTIREGKGRIRLQVSFDPPSQVNIKRGFFLFNGVAIAVSEHGVKCLNNQSVWSKCGGELNGVAFGIGPHLPDVPIGWAMRQVERYAGLSLQKSPGPMRAE